MNGLEQGFNMFVVTKEHVNHYIYSSSDMACKNVIQKESLLSLSVLLNDILINADKCPIESTRKVIQQRWHRGGYRLGCLKAWELILKTRWLK